MEATATFLRTENIELSVALQHYERYAAPIRYQSHSRITIYIIPLRYKMLPGNIFLVLLLIYTHGTQPFSRKNPTIPIGFCCVKPEYIVWFKAKHEIFIAQISAFLPSQDHHHPCKKVKQKEHQLFLKHRKVSCLEFFEFPATTLTESSPTLMAESQGEQREKAKEIHHLAFAKMNSPPKHS